MVIFKAEAGETLFLWVTSLKLLTEILDLLLLLCQQSFFFVESDSSLCCRPLRPPGVILEIIDIIPD